jgi:hypothetical protein
MLAVVVAALQFAPPKRIRRAIQAMVTIGLENSYFSFRVINYHAELQFGFVRSATLRSRYLRQVFDAKLACKHM